MANSGANAAAAQTFGPYSPLYQAGNIVFVSGQVGVDLVSGKAPAGAEEQMRQALRNMQNQLATLGLTMHQVAKTTIYTTDMSSFAVMNQVYEQFFPTLRPARSTVGVAALPDVGGGVPIVVEVEAIAYVAEEDRDE
jgi:2-iminobutanoate/2-iminopropanoate deaminase